MLLELGLSEEKYAAYLADARYRPELERARLRRMDWLENQMVTESGRAEEFPGLAQVPLFGEAGAGAEKRLVIRLEGVGSGAAE